MHVALSLISSIPARLIKCPTIHTTFPKLQLKRGLQHVAVDIEGKTPLGNPQLQQSTGLKLPLHTYQRHALAWMSWRERIGGKYADDTSFAVSSSQQDNADAEAAEMFGVGEGAVHPCWQPVTLPSGLHIYENRYTGGARTLVAVAPMLLLPTSMQQQLGLHTCRSLLQSAHLGSLQLVPFLYNQGSTLIIEQPCEVVQDPSTSRLC